MTLHVCPTEVVRASADRVWCVLTTPRELAAWSEATLIEAPEREMRVGDHLVLGAGIGHRFRVIVHVREAVRPQLLVLNIRLPFGVTNHETIRISPLGSNESRVTYN